MAKMSMFCRQLGVTYDLQISEKGLILKKMNPESYSFLSVMGLGHKVEYMPLDREATTQSHTPQVGCE